MQPVIQSNRRIPLSRREKVSEKLVELEKLDIIEKDCPGAYNMSDDFIIVGATQEEHDIRLEKVVQKLNELGLTLNATKCQINVHELTYMGHVLTS